MTQDEIIEIAIQLGFDERLSNNWLVSEEQLMRFYKLAAAKEREWFLGYIKEHQPSCEQISKAIQARGEA